MWRYLGISVILILTAMVYGPVLQSEYVAYDDELLIVDNVKARGVTWENVKAAFTTYDPELYIPLMLLTEQIEYSIVGTWNPAVSHGISLGLHIMNAVLVFALVTLLLGRFQRADPRFQKKSNSQFVAIAIATLWAVHPLNVEAVAWAAARKDLLSGFFFLLSVCLYIRWRERVTPSGDEGRHNFSLVSWFVSAHHDKWYWFSIFSFLLGLLAKVSIAPLPLVLLLLEWCKTCRTSRLAGCHGEVLQSEAGEPRIRTPCSHLSVTIWHLLPYFLLSIVFVIIALLGKKAQVHALGVTLLAPFVAIPFYLQKLVVPTGLSILYPFTEELTLLHPAVLLGLFIVSGLVALSLWSLRWTREIAGALGIFLLLLAPSFLNVARRGDAGMVDLVIASDRYMYLPSLVLIALAGYWLLVIGYSLSHSPSLPAGRQVPAAAGEGGTTAVRVRGCLLFLGFVGLLGFFGFLTHRQLRVWHDSEALFRNVLTQHLSSHIAANNLAGFLAKKGEIAEAMDFYRQSLAVRENPRALFNLGRLLMSEKRFREALPLFERYVALKPRDAFGRMQLGGLYLMQDDPMSARPHLEGAVARDPNLTEAHYLLGVAFEQLGDGTRARKEFQETLRLEPNHPHARGKLGKFPPPVFDSEAQTRGAGEG